MRTLLSSCRDDVNAVSMEVLMVLHPHSLCSIKTAVQLSVRRDASAPAYNADTLLSCCWDNVKAVKMKTGKSSISTAFAASRLQFSEKRCFCPVN